MFYGACAETAT